MNPLLEQFLQEARENLAFIDQNIENILDGDAELLNSVFRAAHTLKGGSGIVGFESVKEITHHAEDLLDQVRAGKLEFTKDMESGLYDAFDEVVNLIEAAEESEEIVDAAPERIEEIVELMNSLMGKEHVEETWESPMRIISDDISVVNDDLPFLSEISEAIPFVSSEINEENMNDTRLYAIFFDLDENCMVFGNDPFYALSLLGDKLKYVSSCMDDDSASQVLSGESEDDLLVFRMTVIAYVYGSYDDIEEALFNFIDDLLFKPLDIVTLLNITRGEVTTLDVIKDFAKHGAEKFLSSDISGLKSSIAETLTLIGNETIQSRKLTRLNDIVDNIDAANYDQMVSFFENLNSSNELKIDASAKPVSEVATPKVEETPIVETPSSNIDYDEKDKERLFDMLNQQLVQLRKNNNEATKTRVEALVTNPIKNMGYDFHDYYASVESLIEGIEAIVLGTPEVKEEIMPTQEPVEEKVETPAAEPVAKAVETKAVETKAPVKETAPSKPATVESSVVTEAPVEKTKNVIGKTVKIEQESIDHLMNIVGELLVAKNSLPYLADNVSEMNKDTIKRSILEKYSMINRLSMQLQDLIMGMRMLPISYVFDRYPKLVRDISKTLDKKVNLTMDGGDTKLDKNIIEMMADPMIHIMRNSLDHAIEMPEDRLAAGKSAEGNVNLKAYAQSDKIIIEIKDDGAGINVDKVINKVLEKGLMSPEVVENLTDRERAELVLLPGLSTADSITEFSGRGVGMDVVKKSIEGFGGTINIVTASGKGTTITLAIPVSLAVTSLLHVLLGNVHYGFPMESVKETVKIEQSEVAILHNEPFVYLRGDVIPLLYIKNMIDMEAIGDGILSIVVLNIKGNLIAVVVNELLGQLDVVQKPLEGLVENHPIFSGTALLGNGQIIMVIDQDGLLGMSHTLKEDEKEAS
jgi:two-component system, chemotaxis family, sensor kinase CheA